MNSTNAISINLTNDNEYRKVFDGFYVSLCLFANKYVENEAMSADIVQDCFVKLWQIRREFFFLHQVKSFLYTSVRNRALNEIEHSKIVNEYAEKIIKKSKDGFFHDNIIEEETYRTLTKAIDQLPNQMRAIMYLALEGNSNNEIAEKLTVSIDTVKSLKKIAYKKLRILLKDYYYLLPLIIDGFR
ncbi:RNA polymerase sigma-70 factor [Bacteroides sp. 519]|uniref:RNA polymerase sigma-70 factor n=1 Tax=Bacteroides sp. 519 TaxID=2302937 RepID=UPI0013D0FA6F|nr:RNA polymerase sigma-70 factor [Bacteroides sp. 519]